MANIITYSVWNVHNQENFRKTLKKCIKATHGLKFSHYSYSEDGNTCTSIDGFNDVTSLEKHMAMVMQHAPDLMAAAEHKSFDIHCLNKRDAKKALKAVQIPYARVHVVKHMA